MVIDTSPVGGIWLRFEVEPVVSAPDLAWFKSHLEAVLASGQVAPESTIPVGWGLVRVVRQGDGTLSLVELDLTRTPMTWRVGVTQTLLQRRTQLDALSSLAVQTPSFASFFQVCRWGVDVVSGQPGTVLERRPPRDPSDSGFFVGKAGGLDGSQAEHVVLRSLHEAACVLPEIVRYMAVPPGMRVVLERGVARFEYLDRPRLASAPIRTSGVAAEVLRRRFWYDIVFWTGLTGGIVLLLGNRVFGADWALWALGLLVPATLHGVGLVWRCPKCGRFLGSGRNPPACPHCSVSFTVLEDP